MEAENSWQVANPSSKTKGLVSSLATVATLILALLCKGMLTQNLDFSIKVPPTIILQKGSCAYVPCSFNTPNWFMATAGPLYVFWFKDADKSHSWILPGYWLPGKLVFTNKENHNLTTTHFTMTGDPQTGDCSFSIRNIGPEDVGWYYLRIEKGDGYSFLSIQKRIHAQPHIFLTDLKKPKILTPSEVIWGKPATFRCFMPGVCPGSKTQIFWDAELKEHINHLWHTQESDWSETYGADITFTPSLDDEGKVLTCSIKYNDLKKSVHETARLAFGYRPEAATTTTTGSTTCQHEKKGHVCFCSIHSWPPSKIEWHVDGKLVNETVSSGAMQLVSWVEGNTVSSTLSWSGDSDDQKKSLITCTGTNAYGTVTINVSSELNMTSAVTKSPPDEKMELSSGIISGIVLGLIAAVVTVGGIVYSFLGFRRQIANVSLI